MADRLPWMQVTRAGKTWRAAGLFSALLGSAAATQGVGEGEARSGRIWGKSGQIWGKRWRIWGKTGGGSGTTRGTRNCIVIRKPLLPQGSAEQRLRKSPGAMGIRKVEGRRREALRQWLPMLLDLLQRAGEGGLSVRQAVRETAAVPGFAQALKAQRASLLQVAVLWPDQISVTHNVMTLRGAPVARARPQRPRARPRRPRWAMHVFAAPRPQEFPEDA